MRMSGVRRCVRGSGPRGLRARRGFSLFEAVISLTIVGMISVYSLNAVSVAFDTAFRARRAIEMDALLNQRLDWLNMMQASTFTTLPDSLAQGTFDYPNNGYIWQMTATPYQNQPGIFDIQISVIPTTGSAGMFTVHTYVYRRTAVNTVTAGVP